MATATAFALLAGVLLPCWGALPQFGKELSKVNGVRCSHHSECSSGCCLMDLNNGGAFCAPKARRDMVCLPQTKAATNIVCPCQLGLSCTSRDLNCPSRCRLI